LIRLPKHRHRGAAVGLALLLAAGSRPAGAEPPANPELHAVLRSGWDRVAKGDLDGADRQWETARALDPTHPGPPAFQARTLQMRRFLDYPDPRFDDAIEACTQEAIRLAEEWLERDSESARAHLYLGQALYDQMLLYGIQRHYYKAGTRGERGRKALERALQLDPSLVDAKLPLGTYYVYASVATRYVGWLSWLWFIPTGERDKGLAYLRDALEGGDLFDSEAAMTLQAVHHYLDDAPEKSLPLLGDLLARYPDNSLARFERIEALFALERYDDVLREAQRAIERPARYWGDAERKEMARVWRARVFAATGRSHEALQELDAVSGSSSIIGWTRRWAELVRGQAYDLAGERERARDHYESARDMSDYLGGDRVRELAESGLASPYEARSGPVAAAPPGS